MNDELVSLGDVPSRPRFWRSLIFVFFNANLFFWQTFDPFADKIPSDISASDRAEAARAHSGMAPPIWVPLSIARSEERNQFVYRHAIEAANFQICVVTLFALWLLGFLGLLVWLGAPGDQLPPALGLWCCLPFLSVIPILGQMAQGIVAALNGYAWRYRVTIRFIRDGQKWADQRTSTTNPRTESSEQ